ncbi:hypothetical protein [Bifidobacterium tissieri]|uniref:hypothetical protein n=1 Tax=Bifidobacterium tissieri TaxID=1630162 RepID=UPI00168AC725|nr:hypothetical protein [Bifidobacterium tissieri]
MFGNQPQYGYQHGGYQPQYGGYQQQPQSAAGLSSVADLLAGNSAKSHFNADSQPGDSVTGTIEKIDVAQVQDFQTKQPAYWPDGKPKEQFHIIIQTTLRDPSVEDDDGRRSLWVKGWGLQLKALRDACRQAGVKLPKPGDVITMTYRGLGERGNAPQPPKVYEFRLQPASSAKAETLLNGPQTAATPNPGIRMGQGVNAPQTGVQGANQAYQPTQPQSQVSEEQARMIRQLKNAGADPHTVASQLGLTYEQVMHAAGTHTTGQGSENGEPEF